MMTNPQRQQLFEHWAASYDSTVANQVDFPFVGYEQVLETIVAEAQLQPALSVLDLGTGTGNLAARLAQFQANVVGIDFSAEMLSQAQQKVPAGTFFPLDLLAENWTILEGYHFDRVVVGYVLHEFPLERVVTILDRLRRNYAAPQLRIVIGDIAFPDTEIRAQAQAYWQESWDTSEYYFAADEACRAFEQVGFQARYQQQSSCAGVFVLEI